MITDLESLKQCVKPAFMSDAAWESFKDLAEKILTVQENLHPILEGEIVEQNMDEIIDGMEMDLVQLSESIDDFIALSSGEDEEDLFEDGPEQLNLGEEN